MQRVIKIYHVVQEVRTFSLTGSGRKDSPSDYSANPRVVQSVMVLITQLAVLPFYRLLYVKILTYFTKCLIYDFAPI